MKITLRLDRLAIPIALLAFAPACGGGGGEDLDQIGTEATGADAIALNGTARVWRTSASIQSCGAAAVTEDYSSGRYNAHRWAVTLEAGTTRISFQRTAGSWQPALVLALSNGTFITDGEAVDAPSGVDVTTVSSGRSGATAAISIRTTGSLAINVYTTSWGASDSNYSASITRSAEYELRFDHTCGGGGGGGGGTGWQALHRGLDLSGSKIPRAGVANGTLRASLGIAVEPYGSVVTQEGLSFVRGRVSWFGGPNDTGVTSTETGAISGERLRSLNSPTRPSAATLASRPEDYYFIAMRFDYSPNGRTFWRNARLLVMNPANGAAIVVRPVDWGPNTRTARVLDLSPQSMVDLGLDTDDNAIVAFAAPGSPLGVVR